MRDRLTVAVTGLWPGFAWPPAFAEPVLVSTDRARERLGRRPAYSSRSRAALASTRAGLGL